MSATLQDSRDDVAVSLIATFNSIATYYSTKNTPLAGRRAQPCQFTMQSSVHMVLKRSVARKRAGCEKRRKARDEWQLFCSMILKIFYGFVFLILTGA